MAKIINKTPHPVNVVSKEGEAIVTYNPEGEPARCSQETIVIGDINDIPLTKTSFGDVLDLPDPQPDTFYIVSRLVLSACPDRNDLIVPNELVRDDEGHIIGCMSFAIN